MTIPLHFLTKSEIFVTEPRKVQREKAIPKRISKTLSQRKRRRSDRSNEEDTERRTRKNEIEEEGLDRKCKIREKGEEDEWIVENRQRGLVRRVGPRAFPRFREAYRTTALRFASLIPSLDGPRWKASSRCLYNIIYGFKCMHTLTEPGGRVLVYTYSYRVIHKCASILDGGE